MVLTAGAAYQHEAAATQQEGNVYLKTFELIDFWRFRRAL
jgi:hypothetical protein